MYMYVPTRSNVKLADTNMGHAQGIEIILYQFTICPNIHPLGQAYFCPVNLQNTISLGTLKWYVGSKKVTS